MKQFLTRTAAIAVLSAGAILAQGPLHHEGTDNPPDVATIVAREVNFLTHLLALTTGQQTQATTIFTNALNSIAPLETGIATARTALATAIKANDAAGIATQSAAIGTAEGQITAIQAKADAAFYALLTTDQKATLNNLDGDFLDLGVGGIHLPGGH